MRGEIVLVRAFGGKPLKRRVWAVGNGVVYITNDEQFRNLISRRRSIKPVGFPAEDVFKAACAPTPDTGLIDWSALARWEYDNSNQGTRSCPPDIAATQPELVFNCQARKEFNWRAAEQLAMFATNALKAPDGQIRHSKKILASRNTKNFSSVNRNKEGISESPQWSLLTGLTNDDLVV